jgi:hypothetical protein
MMFKKLTELEQQLTAAQAEVARAQVQYDRAASDLAEMKRPTDHAAHLKVVCAEKLDAVKSKLPPIEAEIEAEKKYLASPEVARARKEFDKTLQDAQKKRRAIQTKAAEIQELAKQLVEQSSELIRIEDERMHVGNSPWNVGPLREWAVKIFNSMSQATAYGMWRSPDQSDPAAEAWIKAQALTAARVKKEADAWKKAHLKESPEGTPIGILEERARERLKRQLATKGHQ